MAIQPVLPAPAAEAAAEPRLPPAQAAAWDTWPSVQLWLWPGPVGLGMRGRMRAVLAEALTRLPAAQIARVAALAEDDDPAAALRLAARLLYTGESGSQQCADLCATALAGRD